MPAMEHFLKSMMFWVNVPVLSEKMYWTYSHKNIDKQSAQLKAENKNLTELAGNISLSVCLTVSLSVCLPLSVCLSVSLCLSVCPSLSLSRSSYNLNCSNMTIQRNVKVPKDTDINFTHTCTWVICYTLTAIYTLSAIFAPVSVSWQFSGTYGTTSYGNGWRKYVVNQCQESAGKLFNHKSDALPLDYHDSPSSTLNVCYVRHLSKLFTRLRNSG